jgi:hypothetical protein
MLRIALRRPERISKLDRKTNEYIRGKMYAQDTMLDEITRKQLIWYGHDRMRLAKIMINWKPEERRKRGRPRRTWKDGIYTAMKERGRMEQSKAMEYGIRKASPDVLKPRNIHKNCISFVHFLVVL